MVMKLRVDHASIFGCPDTGRELLRFPLWPEPQNGDDTLHMVCELAPVIDGCVADIMKAAADHDVEIDGTMIYRDDNPELEDGTRAGLMSLIFDFPEGSAEQVIHEDDLMRKANEHAAAWWLMRTEDTGRGYRLTEVPGNWVTADQAWAAAQEWHQRFPRYRDFERKLEGMSLSEALDAQRPLNPARFMQEWTG